MPPLKTNKSTPSFISFVGAYSFYAFLFISVWCFFVALLSGLVLLHFPNDG